MSTPNHTDTPVKIIPALGVFNPWQIMLDLNAGHTVVVSKEHANRVMSYFKIHGTCLSHFYFDYYTKKAEGLVNMKRIKPQESQEELEK